MDSRDVAMLAYASDATVLRLAARELHREQKPGPAKYALWAADVLDRARRAELTDPAPDERPWCVCETCQAWLFTARWQRLIG
jgi:hypothetical protein